VQRFFPDEQALLAFFGRLIDVICPACGGCGRMVRHGYVRGWVSPQEHGIRAWRVFCDTDSPRGAGCGRTQSLRLSTTLERRCFSTAQLWKFFCALLVGESVRSAWKTCAIALSQRTAYRLRARLESCQSLLRTRLSSRAPPPPGKEGGLLQVLAHLKEAFGICDPIRGYQMLVHHGFLATS
jgi:hypothetical protein